MDTYKEVQGSVLWGRALFVAHLTGFTSLAVYRAVFAGRGPGWFLGLSMALFVFLIVNFWRMSVRVNGESVTVSFGLIRKRLPLSEIDSCQPTAYKWSKYGGWGVRRSVRDGSVSWSASGKSAVALNTPTRKYVITTPDPDRLCEVIAQFKKGSNGL
ncbi:MAG: hypothetical protein HY671_01420 [Chloroflexi bacterium]|nr:hypothetical protein [Chloroflexota bacterium]